MLDTIKEHWRLLLVGILVISSLGFVFGIGGLGGGTEQGPSDLTTLQYGLQLEGGTRFTVPLEGVTAENVTLSNKNTVQVSENIANKLSVPSTQVSIIQTTTENNERITHIEVTSSEVTTKELRSVLNELNISYETIRTGVTQETRKQTINVITNKINQSGLSGGTARIVTSATGDKYVMIEVPGEGRTKVRELLSERGSVRIDLYYPVQTESGERKYKTIEAVLTSEDFKTIGSAQMSSQLGPHVPVTLKQSSAVDFRHALDKARMIPRGSTCTYNSAPKQTGPCLLTKVDGKVVYSAGMSPDLAQSIASGQWQNAPKFVLQTSSMEQARELSLHLTAGALPTGLDFENGTSVYVSPTQGERFKTAGLIIGLAALFAVGIKVFIRYRDLRVAAPMVAMSLSEIIILLGFASLVGYPIDLAVIAGFVAVIGTGVDDLIIIANEVFAQGNVSSERVFESRYSKAIWIIMAAAITTSIALSPLIVLSLGKLGGFAIFTIIGIAIGVFVTRPAYADILNYLFTDK